MLFSPLIERAIELSAEWHDQTYRKSRWRDQVIPSSGWDVGGVPVMAHLAAVAVMVQRAGWGDEAVAAAFLHDVLEDRNRLGDHMTVGTLRTLMGEEVTRLVEGVTEPKFDDRGQPLPWRTRKEAYVATLSQAPDESLAISLADKLHNLWSMGRSLEAGIDVFSNAPGRKKLSAGPSEQLWFYRAVLSVAAERTEPRLDGLRRELVEEVRRFDRITEARRSP